MSEPTFKPVVLTTTPIHLGLSPLAGMAEWIDVQRHVDEAIRQAFLSCVTPLLDESIKLPTTRPLVKRDADAKKRRKQ